MATTTQFLQAIDKILKVKGEIDNLLGASKAITHAITARRTAQLDAVSNEINKLRNLSSKWNNEISRLLAHDENWWFNWSGTNALSPVSSTNAVKKVTQLREKLVAFRDACQGLITLTWTVLAAQNANVKGLARAYVPSLVIMDAIVAQQTVTGFNACKTNTSRLIQKLDCIQTALKGTSRLAHGLRR